MAEIPKQMQDKLAQFQTIQSQLQMIMAQKQQLILTVADIENAVKELGKSGGGKVYRMVGPLLVETTKEESEKDLSEGKETAETRIKVLEKQEKKLNEKFEELRTEIQEMIREKGGGLDM